MLLFFFFFLKSLSFFYTDGESLLIIPQCLCRLICMWLISVWRSCLWSAGRNPDSSVLHNLRDVLEIEFPSPATHEKSVCHTVAPLSISNMSILTLITSGVLCVCVFIYACILLFVCLFELQVIRGRTCAIAYFSIFFFLSLFCFFHEVGTNSPLIGLFTEKIIRITKMVEFSALSNGFNHAKTIYLSVF